MAFTALQRTLKRAAWWKEVGRSFKAHETNSCRRNILCWNLNNTVLYYSSSVKMTTNGVVPVNEVHRFVSDCMLAAGASKDGAAVMADVLLAADNRGHYSHGLNRLDMYVKDVKTKICDASANPTVIQESAATALVDGNNALGPVVGMFCMNLAINKARESGVGWVCARGSNHYGIAGFYAMKALEHGMLGMSFTNTSPLMSPTRSKSAALGTNPIAVAAPGQDGDSFVLDMATTTVAVGKIELERRKKEPIPEGWAQDANGQITTDPNVAMDAGCLMPLGGPEINSGYKGYGLSAMVEVFCGIMAGATYGPNVRRWMKTDQITNLGQCFVAVNLECFAPGFQERMSDLMSSLRNLEPTEPDRPVLVAGDPERQHIAKVESQGGIQYHPNQIEACLRLAQKLNVEPMKVVEPLKC